MHGEKNTVTYRVTVHNAMQCRKRENTDSREWSFISLITCDINHKENWKSINIHYQQLHTTHRRLQSSSIQVITNINTGANSSHFYINQTIQPDNDDCCERPKWIVVVIVIITTSIHHTINKIHKDTIKTTAATGKKRGNLRHTYECFINQQIGQRTDQMPLTTDTHHITSTVPSLIYSPIPPFSVEPRDISHIC